ncbi:terminase small subunit [Pseudomonas gregormendelii]|uniref:Terminase small subunit n=1 Tax=Pseudomonas gregormendelii TaxID=1628277 RepID=A0ABS3AFB1_9PSED|nr:terminase small subunit [Pseudomonas gregormendelii]MBN3965833.1 terminase small subunit [Pseudomonas gregormendelii]
MPLTDKKRRFADALLSGASKSQAAIDAGYSAKTAAQAGSKLAKDNDVINYIQRATSLEALLNQVKSGAKKVKFEVHEVNFETGQTNGFPALVNSVVAAFDSRALLERIARDNEKLNPELAAKIALGLMPYDHPKKSDIGKKEAKENAAQQVAKGKFSASAPPATPLRSVK